MERKTKCTLLCSNHCCNKEAVQLSPRHLCASCIKDPKLNGPEPVFVNTKEK